ncbi:MAG: hypothetical protein M3P16_04410 [Chloroflexota bacterium]|nr:hypothetical protein [Chloroflexota bacterium]
MLHKILTAVTALAVVASLLAGAAGQAAAVTGYDSAYFGESAFLTLGPGQSGQFAVGFNNTGSTGWLTGSASQVDLAICLPDKTTCNTTSPNAAFASSWSSSTAYATTSTTFVGPGQTGFFVYNVTVPAGSAPGTYRFNGDLALHGTGSMIHPQGYYQDVQVPSVGAAAKLGCVANPTSIPAGTNQSGVGATSTITVTIQDALGNTTTGDSSTKITLSQAGGLGATINGGAADASATITATNGVATFTLTAPASSANTGTDQLSASSPTFPTLTGCQANVTFTGPGAATALSLALGQTTFNSPAGGTSTATATLVDSNGNTTTNTGTAAITVTFSTNNSTICTVNASTQTIAVGGSSTAGETFTMTGVPGSCTVTASATGLTSGTATANTIAAGPAAQLAITANTCVNTLTTSNTAGSQCYIRVAVQDAAGNTIVGSAAPITVTYYKTGVTPLTACSAGGSTTSGGPYTNPGPVAAVESAGSASLKVWVADAVAQSCDATATSAGLTSTTAAVTFTGFGAAANLGAPTFTPNPIPANGVATSTITVCVRDAAGNKVTSGTGSTDAISLVKTLNASATTLLTVNPQTAVAGCASFTVQSTTTVATDGYTASDVTRGGITPTPQATISTTTP